MDPNTTKLVGQNTEERRFPQRLTQGQTSNNILDTALHCGTHLGWGKERCERVEMLGGDWVGTRAYRKLHNKGGDTVALQ